jgi:hypothetical protein
MSNVMRGWIASQRSFGIWNREAEAQILILITPEFFAEGCP